MNNGVIQDSSGYFSIPSLKLGALFSGKEDGSVFFAVSNDSLYEININGNIINKHKITNDSNVIA